MNKFLLPNSQIYMQCPRHLNGQDEGRDAFKSLKNQQIADKSALLYETWAELEVKSGEQCNTACTAAAPRQQPASMPLILATLMPHIIKTNLH